MGLYMNRLACFSSWYKAAVLLGFNFAIQAIILFVMYPAISPSISPLDVQFFLTPTSVDVFFTGIGASGRTLYFINEATIDMLFPLVYSLAYVLLLIELLKSNGSTTSRLMYLALLPCLLAVADVVENIQILISLDLYPMQSDAVIHTLYIANIVKHSLSAVLLFVVLVLILKVLGRKRLSWFKCKGVRDG